MRIGIIREGKLPADKRTPFTPEHCSELLVKYPELHIQVQRSSTRCFDDIAYQQHGAELTDDVNNCDVIFGVKEVPYHMLAPGKTMFFFSHTIKQQPYNRELLREVLRQKVRLIDYETLTYPNGVRVLGFGRYAGIVGAYHAINAYGMRYKKFDLKPPFMCSDMNEMGSELKKANLPGVKIVISGGGKVANGAKETMAKAGIRQVSINEFLHQNFDEPVFCNPDVLDYHELTGNAPANFSEFVKNSSVWENNFIRFAKVADIFISSHFWDNKSAHFFTKNDVAQDYFKLKVIADITCDINGSVPTTIRSSTIENPLYGYDRFSGQETAPFAENSITVMAVDNLPCEVPKDASRGFGQNLIDLVMPLLMEEDPDDVLTRATIAENGKLTERFNYLHDFVAVS